MLAAAPELFGPPAAPPVFGPQSEVPVVPGLGPRLRTRLRRDGLAKQQRVLVHTTDPSRVGARGQVFNVLGPIVSASLDGAAILELAQAGAFLDTPQPLRPALDVSRVEVGADVLDQGLDLPARLRGTGVLTAIYDTGLDLSHPDFRVPGGASRLVAAWDQAGTGAPPTGQTYGRGCTEEDLKADRCPLMDRLGHGTSVMGVLAGNGPQYRGLAPEAELAVARSDDFEGLIDAIAWFQALAQARSRPLVVNLSLAGQEGPHDGTSLEAQALEALPYLVVVAAGNEGRLAVHARVTGPGPSTVVLQFPLLAEPATRKAVVDVWATGPISGRVVLLDEGGVVLAATSSLAPGGGGGTEALGTIGEVDFDAEAGPNPFNQKRHLRFALELKAYQDPPEGPGRVGLELTGGPADLWVDTPASEAGPVRFVDRRLWDDGQVLGDTSTSLSDLATAPQVVAVSSYMSRNTFTNPEGKEQRVGGTLLALSDFSAYGPTLAANGGPKPDLAAPGAVIVTAKSSQAPDEPARAVDRLYRAVSGTSFASPHVAGAAAALLSGQPTLAKANLKAALLENANADGADRASDERWGAGRLDAAATARALYGESGCGCRAHLPRPTRGAANLAGFVALLALLGARRPRRTAA